MSLLGAFQDSPCWGRMYLLAQACHREGGVASEPEGALARLAAPPPSEAALAERPASRAKGDASIASPLMPSTPLYITLRREGSSAGARPDCVYS